MSDGHNTVRGNYIGTNAGGVIGVGNRWAGVAVDRSGYNVIGPANVIAYNGGPGIAIYTTGSVRNRITQNSIHDNSGPGIDLWDGGNTELAAPLIFDFDLSAGTVAGTTCANCTVEIFSDSGDEGGVYEGRTTASGTGYFTFNKGTPFTGPHLTTTAIDADGNTSRFSLPVSGSGKSLILQEGNHLPKTRLQLKRSQELEDNHIGIDLGSYYPGLDSYSNPELVYPLGFKWMRIAADDQKIDPLNWQYVETEPGKYSIDPAVDDLITDYASNGINIVLNLGDGSGENRPGATKFTAEEEVERYCNFARFMVHHFIDRIRYYEIWNEPGDIAVQDYANLIEQVAPIIREEDPTAKIVIGAMGGHG